MLDRWRCSNAFVVRLVGAAAMFAGLALLLPQVALASDRMSARVALAGATDGFLALLGLAPAQSSTLSAPFTRQVLEPVLPEAPLSLRLFAGAVKTDSQHRVITGPTSDPVKNLVGAQAAGERAGIVRFTKILFGVDYFNGRPDPGTRIDPNHPHLSAGSQHWPFVPQPFRSQPNALALTPDGAKLYVGLPGKEGYPDWRVAVVDTASRRVQRWVDLRPAGQTRGTRPTGLAVHPSGNYLVVLNEYGNFGSVIDTTSDSVLGEFETGFYAEKLVFNADGTRMYVSIRNTFQLDRRGVVRAFRVDPGPVFTQIGEIPTGPSELEQANPRDLALSTDGSTLYVANTLGNRVAVINVGGDANALVGTLPHGGLPTDIKIAGRWGIVSGHETNTCLNQPETGHGLPKNVGGGAFIRNSGEPLGYLPVMSDCTQATTFDDIGTELNVFDTSTNRYVFRYVDVGRNDSLLVVAGQHFDLHDFGADQTIIKGSGAEQMFVRGDLLFVSQLHSDKLEVFRINQATSTPAGILTEVAIEFTGGISPQGIAASPDGRTVYVSNMQTEDISFLGWDGARLIRQGILPVGVTPSTPDPVKGGHGAGLFATQEEIGLRWLFSDAYSDDGQKSCGFCHWQSRHDGAQWNVGANAVGGVKISPQNKDISDNWPEWFEGLNNDMTAYASACNGELNVAERPTALFPQPDLVDRLHARDEFVKQKTAENSTAIGRSDLNGAAFSTSYADMAFKQIVWSQNETRRMPNPLSQFPTQADQAKIARGQVLFSTEVAQGGSGCASCHHNGNQVVDGAANDTFQDWSIHEPGVVAETTVDNEGPFTRLGDDYFFQEFGPPQDVGGRQNISSRNTKHLRSFWDSVPRWLHHGDAHSIREILLAPDSPLLRPGERGFNFRTVRTDASRTVAHDFLGGPPIRLPVEVPITFGDSRGGLGGDGKGPVFVSLDAPTPVPGRDGQGERAGYPEGRLQVDRLGSSNLALLVVNGQINPVLAANHVQVLRDTHGKTSHLSASDLEALELYLKSLQ
jgi:DNA-binding beta-propeller fold protein YncE